jgi:hypothetical protein
MSRESPHTPPAGTTAFQLHWTSLYGHAICIKQHAGEWWWLDRRKPTRQPKPIKMTANTWAGMWAAYCGQRFPPLGGHGALAEAQEFDRVIGLPQLVRPRPWLRAWGMWPAEIPPRSATPPRATTRRP